MIRKRLGPQIVPILALLLSTAFLLAGNGLHSLLLPLRGAAEGFSTAELGLIGTGWATGFVLGCLTAPIVVRRVGHIRAFACSAAFAAIIILLNGIFVDPARLDLPARRLRLLPRRRLHDHRELAERARHQREPRHDLRRLPDGHLSRHHRRPARRRRRRSRARDALHGGRHPLLPRHPADRALDRRLAAAADARQDRPPKALLATRRSRS